MQTINIDGTTYRVKFDRDPLELAKLARKPYKTKKSKGVRAFPTYTPGMSTARYVAQFDTFNHLQPVEYFPRLNVVDTAQYDSTIPLLETFTDE